MRLPAFLISRSWFWMIALLFLIPFYSRGEEDVPLSAAQKKEQAQREAEEEEIKKQFGFSSSDIQDSLVIVSCQSKVERLEGTGFIAQMDGKTYLFTSKKQLMGADKITFKTIGGKLLRPRGIEFSTSRNIARFLLPDEKGLILEDKKLIGLPVAVFGNSEGSGVITEFYGKITELGSEKFEVSAPFVSGNNGSPVLSTNMQVVGMASYISLKKRKEKKDEDEKEEEYESHHFCVPLLRNHKWIPINWKTYNRRYGKPFLENEQIFDPILGVVQKWIENPYRYISIGKCRDPEIEEWLELHNGMISRLVLFSKRDRVTELELSRANRGIHSSLNLEAEMLVEICKKYRKKIGFRALSFAHEPSGFVQREYEQYLDYLEHAELAIPFIRRRLVAKDFFHFKEEEEE